MKNLKRTTLLSVLVIAFTLATASCAKHKVKKELNDTWTLNSVTQNGVDVYAQMGATITGTWTFNKKEKKCAVSTTMSSSFGTETSTGEMSYKVVDKETITLDGEVFKIEELTSATLILALTDNTDTYRYYFTK